MPYAEIDGIRTYYELHGSGPPLLMFSPGGFNAVVENWSRLGVYRQLRLVEQLSEHFTCITFDRREAGRSGGRVERLDWSHYVTQGLGLLDHLGHDRAHLLGGCVGCSISTAIAIACPERVSSLVLYSPAGGAHYRMGQHDRFSQHLAFVIEHGLEGVLARARERREPFNRDPAAGPWAAVLASDDEFADGFVTLDAARYQAMVAGAARALFDRDTVPGAEPEDLMVLDVPTLIVPGEDRSHSPSAAHYLAETLATSTLWDVPVAEQRADTAPPRILRFLGEIGP